MSLGFSVETLVPAGRGGGALRMGLSRVAEREWLFPDPDLATRARTFAAHPGSILIRPEAEAAAREAAAAVGVTGGLTEAAHAVWEDLCLLQPLGPDGMYVLTAGALAFPTDWHLAEKIGLPVAAIHAPIHGYAEQLADAVDHALATLRAGPVFGRTNWFVVASADWRYLPDDDPATRFAHVTPDNAGDTLFVRCERQTLRRLPQSGAILFTIGVAVAPLAALSPAVVQRVAAGIAAQPDGERKRRAAPHYAAPLIGYAARRTLLEAA